MQGCRDLVTHEGIFAGGSSGSVVAALKKPGLTQLAQKSRCGTAATLIIENCKTLSSSNFESHSS